MVLFESPVEKPKYSIYYKVSFKLVKMEQQFNQKIQLYSLHNTFFDGDDQLID